MPEFECCGNCKYHKPDGEWPDDWVCTCAESDKCGDWTEYEEVCDFWDQRESRKGKKK